jgi:mono/diheme cytochrome c family protein
VLLLLLVGVGCRQDMHNQPKYQPFEESDFFENGISSRVPVEGTVARGQLRADTHLYTGRSGDGAQQWATTFPFEVTAEALDRGQQRFDIYCSVCHDRTGSGNGMVVQRGFRRPPTFHQDRLREAPVGYLFDVITNGFGAMPDYRAQIRTEDRWLIVAYLRALQLSQNAGPDDVPADQRPLLSAATGN